ncbi:MAG: methyl-accepting chemotaxis protein [Lachnospiraceae bacterium]|nr:methyl-accepting chemotaxis protein [Lachnospiraceae bacterium]
MKIKCRKTSITTKVFLISMICFLLCDIAIGVFVGSKTKTELSNQLKNNAISHAKELAAAIDGDKADALLPGDEYNEDWQAIYKAAEFYQTNSGMNSVYVLRKSYQNAQYLVKPASNGSFTKIGADLGNIDEAMAQAFGGSSAADEDLKSNDGKSYYCAYSPIKNSKGIVVAIAAVETDSSSVADARLSILLIMILVFVAFFVLAGAMLLFCRRQIIKSFDSLYTKIEDLTDGSGDLTKHIDISSGDEFEVIAHSINVFIAQIRGLVAMISETSASISQSSDDATQSVLLNSDFIKNINNGISNIGENLVECNSSIETVSSKITETSEMVSSFTKAIEDIGKQSAISQQNAETAKTIAISHSSNSKAAISSLTRNMEGIREEVKKIEQIKEIAETISAIAEQTQILSLNAQIEAARAGEQGRGFAVVATDIEKLSYEISTAVDEIKRVNNKVLGSVNEMINGTQELTAFMTSQVIPDYEAFAEIGSEYGDSTLRINSTISGLKDESQNMERLIDEINHTVKNISLLLTSSNKTAGLIGNSATDISDSMSTLSMVSAESAHKSNKLNNTVSKYKFN